MGVLALLLLPLRGYCVVDAEGDGVYSAASAAPGAPAPPPWGVKAALQLLLLLWGRSWP